MKVLHTTPSLTLSNGGPTQSVFYTVKGLQIQGLKTDILTYQPDGNDNLISTEDFIVTLPKGVTSFAYSAAYKQYLKTHPYDLYHAQGIWQYPTYITAKTARKYNKPYIITPRGMLYPQALNVSKRKKQLFLKLFLLNDLNKAATVHVTCPEEMQHLRNLGVKSPIAVIPNPVNIPEISLISTPDKIRLGYLGRVHPRKNIERLLYVWHKLKMDNINAELIIIGDGDKQYMNFLKTEKERLNLRNVVFTGFLSGKAKENVLNLISYLIVPSDFENFGMIIPEALIKEIPVIASKGTPWEELNTHNCGWWVNNDTDTLVTIIEKAINIPESERRKMGKNGRNLVMENYSKEVVAQKMNSLYKWILNDKEKPGFVFEI